eukprot:5376499-Pyramimonas_sp.AAC.2
MHAKTQIATRSCRGGALAALEDLCKRAASEREQRQKQGRMPTRAWLDTLTCEIVNRKKNWRGRSNPES